MLANPIKGQTPVIQFHFNWNHVSVIAGLTRTNCMFRLHEGSIKKEEIVAFLKALKAHLQQRLLVIWDGLKAHRSRLVREYLEAGVPFQQEQRRIRWHDGGYRSVPVLVVDVGGSTVELLVFGPLDLRQAPPCPIDGRPQRRAAAAEVECLLDVRATAEQGAG